MYLKSYSNLSPSPEGLPLLKEWYDMIWYDTRMVSHHASLPTYFFSLIISNKKVSKLVQSSRGCLKDLIEHIC